MEAPLKLEDVKEPLPNVDDTTNVVVPVLTVDTIETTGVSEVELIVADVFKQLLKDPRVVKGLSIYELIATVAAQVEQLYNAPPDTTDKGAQKSKIVLKIVEAIAKGQDGVSNTADDLLAAETVALARVLLENGLVESYVSTLVKATKGVYALSASVVEKVTSAKKGGCCALM
jgi:hypothetical protein